MKKKDKTNWPAQQPAPQKRPVEVHVYDDAVILDPNHTKKERQQLAAIIESWEK